MVDFINFKGRKILVLGASSGIGKQTALSLDEIGADVIMVARREDKLQEVLTKMSGANNSYYIADLSDLDGIEVIIKKIVEEQGKLDGVVYCAGISMSLPLQMFKPEKLQRIFNINFFAFIETLRQVTKKGRYNEGMRIVGISSIASFKGNKAHLGYCATKAAMDASIRCIAKEVAEKGICINTVAPAMTATEMYESYLNHYGEDSESNKELLSRQYLGIAQTTDVADAIIYLLSSRARFITGITMPVDGGMTTT